MLPPATADNPNPTKVRVLSDGAVFGETCLIETAIRTASVRLSQAAIAACLAAPQWAHSAAAGFHGAPWPMRCVDRAVHTGVRACVRACARACARVCACAYMYAPWPMR